MVRAAALFFDDPAANEVTRKFADVRIPVAAAVSTDELWAPPSSRDALFKGYSGTTVDRIELTPDALGVAQVGHMGYFRTQTGAALWPQIPGWLERHGLQTI